jgi:hypothetical protein
LYLKHQGGGWAAVIVQGGSDLDVFTTVVAAAKAELAKRECRVGRTRMFPLTLAYRWIAQPNVSAI